MAQRTGSVGKLYLPLGSGADVSLQTVSFVDGVGTIAIPAGHDSGAYGLIITTISGYSLPYQYTIDGDIVLSTEYTGDYDVSYTIWSEEAETLTQQCTFFGWSLEETADIHDVSSFCDGAAGARSFIAGLTQWKISAEMFHVDGDLGDITVLADGGGGKVTVTSAAHGLENGRYVVITGTTSYNGTFQISGVTTNTFDIIDTWVANDATGSYTSLPAIQTYLDKAINDFRVIVAYETDTTYWSGLCYAFSSSLNVPLEEPVKRNIEFQGTAQGDQGECILGDNT